ncbi:hypothetical protein JZ751_019158, partial [Albula glossodonta]
MFGVAETSRLCPGVIPANTSPHSSITLLWSADHVSLKQRQGSVREGRSHDHAGLKQRQGRHIPCGCRTESEAGAAETRVRQSCR